MSKTIQLSKELSDAGLTIIAASPGSSFVTIAGPFGAQTTISGFTDATIKPKHLSERFLKHANLGHLYREPSNLTFSF